MTSGFCFRSISWVYIHGFWPYFAHALILTISSIGLLSVHFLSVSYRVTALEWCHNLNSAQYLATEGMDFDQIHALILTTSSLRLLRVKLVNFVNLVQRYNPWMTSEFHFLSVSWIWINGLWPNFAHAIILTTSSLRLLKSIFVNSLQSYDPWMISEFWFRSISYVWINVFWPNFADALILTTS